MADSIKFWIAYVVLVTAVLAVGWNQPLRYRFMTKKEVAEIYATTPAPKPGAWMWDNQRKTTLDRGAYGRTDSKSGYTSPYYFSR